MGKQKLLIRILVNSLFGLLLIFIWSKFVNFSEVGVILGGVDLKFAAAFFVFFGLSGFLRGVRFRFLLGQYKLPLKDMVMLTYLAQMLSFLIPLRVGELTKSVYLSSQFDLPLGKTIVWVFIDRFLDFLMIIVSIALLLLIVPTILPTRFLPIVLGVLLLFTLAFVIAIRSEEILKKIMIFVSNLLIFDNIKRGFVIFTHTIIDGFEVLRRRHLELATLILLTSITLVSDGLIWVSIFAALGLNLGLLKSMLGNGLSALTFLIPSAPGYIGAAEASGLAVFGGALGLEPNLASAGTILMHILTMIALLVFGVTSLYLLKFDLGVVWKKLRKEN